MARSPLREYVPLSGYTTLGLGGPARFFIDCATDEEIREGITFARDHRLPLLILGGGSNMVVADNGFPGVALHLVSHGMEVAPHGYRCTVRVAAGECWDNVVAACVQRGLGGFECLSGIPGTTGATPVQNVGAYGQEVGDAVTVVHSIDLRSLASVTFTREECGFRYRWSRFKGLDAHRYVLTAVEFDLPVTSHAVIRYPELARAIEREPGQGPDGHHTVPLARARETVLRLRAGKGMVVNPADPDSRSAGSFFTNPILTDAEFAGLRERWIHAGGTSIVPSFPSDQGVKVPAAWLVEHAGFSRGTRRGGVGISSKHALALVNYGGSSHELLALAEEIRSRVLEAFGVHLEMEPVIVQSSLQE